MKSPLKTWNKFSSQLKNKTLFLFLDYDGTLTPIVKHPDLAKLKPEHRSILKRLSKQKNIRMAVVSGRSLREVKNKVRVPGIIYAGNHGFELQGSKLRFQHPKAKSAQKILKKIHAVLQKKFKPFKGIFSENKKYTLSIHTRLANIADEKRAWKILNEAVQPYLKKSQIKITHGKKVWEIRPKINWHKGAIVKWILKQPLFQKESPLSLYLGDDKTDEDGFKAIGKKGLGIRVTQNPREKTAAKYSLRSTHEVFKFLQKLL